MGNCSTCEDAELIGNKEDSLGRKIARKPLYDIPPGELNLWKNSSVDERQMVLKHLFERANAQKNEALTNIPNKTEENIIAGIINSEGEDKNQAPPLRNLAVRKLSFIPDYSNPVTKELMAKLPAFLYDDDKPEDVTAPILDPIEMENKAVYIGQWKEGKRHGKGKQLWIDGSVYEGYWRDDHTEGKGRLIHENGDVYSGHWHNDKAHGYGTYTLRDGSLYRGEWYEDQRHGLGYEEWKDGATFQGTYVMGVKEGKGVFKWVDGSIYDGEMYQNQIHGKGKYEWSDGRKYIGSWKFGKMDGHGVFAFPDGRTYDGEYKNDMKNGQGIFSWADGRRYRGAWVDGKQHGMGVFTTADGQEKPGEWYEGKRINGGKLEKEQGIQDQTSKTKPNNNLDLSDAED